MYALLHDITHVPFGHMLEDELGVFKRHDENEGRITFFLGETTDIGKLIVEKYGKEFYETFMQIYEWKESTKSKEDLDSKSSLKSKLVFIHDLVSNTACADLLDYLQRDNYFCNLDTRMSLNFLNYLYLKKENGKKRVCVLLQKGNKPPKKDLITDLCRLLDDRYFIAERVYYHHAKIIAGTMLGRAIQEAKEITEEKMRELSDDTLVDLLIKSKSTLVSKLAKAYKNRKLYRCLKNYSKNDIDKEMQKSKCPKDKIEKFLEDYRTDSNKRKKEIENTISAMTDTEDGDFLVYISDEQMNLKIAKMKVCCNNKIECFGDLKKKNDIIKTRLESTQNSHKALRRIYLLVNNESKIEDKKLKQAEDVFKMLLFKTDYNEVDGSKKSEKVIVFEEAIKFYTQEIIIPGSDEEKTIEIEARKLAQEHGEAARNSDGLRKIFKKIAESIEKKKPPNLLN